MICIWQGHIFIHLDMKIYIVRHNHISKYIKIGLMNISQVLFYIEFNTYEVLWQTYYTIHCVKCKYKKWLCFSIVLISERILITKKVGIIPKYNPTFKSHCISFLLVLISISCGTLTTYELICIYAFHSCYITATKSTLVILF